jgi:hypothetical protein
LSGTATTAGAQLQASVANTGEANGYEQGTPVAVHVPADALRVLGAEAPPPVDPDAAVPEQPDAATEPSQTPG